MSNQFEPDGRLDQTHQWQSATDQGSYMRSFEVGNQAKRRMQIAQWAADPMTPEVEIRAMLTNPMMPPRTGYDRQEPTISQVLDVEAPSSHSLFDYSGTPAGTQSTSRPSLGAMF